MAEYIEREAAVKAAKHAWGKGLEPTQYIEIIPAADVVPVVHGKWIGKPISGFATVGCSVCRKTFSENNGRWKFCPNCGCKMDGGDESAVD